MLDPENPENAVRQGAEQAPRYRGAASNPPQPAASNVISTSQGPFLRMNPGDWVSLTGGQLGGVFNERYACYRWGGQAWAKIPDTESEPYMAALKDITEGAQAGTFSRVLAGKIMALEVTTEALSAKQIRLQKTGCIESGDYVKNVSGAHLGADGFFEAHNAVIRGKVTATEGELDNVTIKQTCTVKELNGTTLNAQTLTMNGQHTAGSTYATSFVLARNNVKITAQGNGVKMFRIAGKGQCRFRLSIQGGWSIERRAANGNWVSAISYTTSYNTTPFDTISVDLLEEINVFRLNGNNLASPYTFENTTFEAWVGNNPGIFKYFSFDF